MDALCHVQGQNPNIVNQIWYETLEPTEGKNFRKAVTFFLMSVVLAMEIVDSNFSQHLLLFQHIPLIMGNNDFPVRDDSDTDMNLAI